MKQRMDWLYLLQTIRRIAVKHNYFDLNRLYLNAIEGVDDVFVQLMTAVCVGS